MNSILKFVYFICPLLGVITSCSETELLPVNGYLGILWQQNDAIGVYGDGTTRNALKNLVTVYQKRLKSIFTDKVLNHICINN